MNGISIRYYQTCFTWQFHVPWLRVITTCKINICRVSHCSFPSWRASAQLTGQWRLAGRTGGGHWAPEHEGYRLNDDGIDGRRRLTGQSPTAIWNDLTRSLDCASSSYDNWDTRLVLPDLDQKDTTLHSTYDTTVHSHDGHVVPISRIWMLTPMFSSFRILIYFGFAS